MTVPDNNQNQDNLLFVESQTRLIQYLSCCPVFQPAGAEDSLRLVQDMEGILLHLLVGGMEDTLALQLLVLLHSQAEGGRQVGNHPQQQDMLVDNLLLVAEEDRQDTPAAVLLGIHLPGQVAWDRASLLAAWALHRQEAVH